MRYFVLKFKNKIFIYKYIKNRFKSFGFRESFKNRLFNSVVENEISCDKIGKFTRSFAKGNLKNNIRRHLRRNLKILVKFIFYGSHKSGISCCKILTFFLIRFNFCNKTLFVKNRIYNCSPALTFNYNSCSIFRLFQNLNNLGNYARIINIKYIRFVYCGILLRSKKNKLIGFHSFIYSRNTLFSSNIKMNK